MADKRQIHEKRLQFVVVKYLRLVLPRDAVLFHVPNGGDMTETADAFNLNVIYRSCLQCGHIVETKQAVAA